jgi:tetratricopeptide (TPR) repeat protein
MRLLVAADPAFRARSNWRDVITSRVRAVSGIYSSAFGISLEVASVSEWNPGTELTAEQKRRGLTGYNSDGNAIFLGFAAPVGDATEPGAAVAFDPRVLVFDSQSKTEEQNQAGMTHELAHAFGAWHSADGSSLLHVPPGSSFDRNAKECIRLTRAVDFRPSVGASHEVMDQVVKLWSASNSDANSNPILDSYLHLAQELLNTGHADMGMEPLSRAIQLAPGNVSAHFMLASANMALKHFAEAAIEFRKVVELSPQNVTGWNNLGGALLQSGQSAEAIPAFRKALELGPNNQVIRANIGAALVRTPGHLDEGIAELREVVRSDPSQEMAQTTLAAASKAKESGRK